jgi:hypothetical protein
MNEFVLVIGRYAGWLYFLLALLALRQLYGIWRAAREHASSLFGLEREAATGKAIRELVSLMLSGTIAVGVYTIATTVAPSLPQQPTGASPPIIQTPPTAALDTDTPTPLPYTPTPPPLRIVTRAPEGAVAPTAVP